MHALVCCCSPCYDKLFVTFYGTALELDGMQPFEIDIPLSVR